MSRLQGPFCTGMVAILLLPFQFAAALSRKANFTTWLATIFVVHVIALCSLYHFAFYDVPFAFQGMHRQQPLLDIFRVRERGSDPSSGGVDEYGYPLNKYRLEGWARAHPEFSCIIGMKDSSRRPTEYAAYRLRCCIRKIRKSMPLALSQIDRPMLLGLGFSSHFVNSLPKHPLPRYKTCAVVGNAPSLRIRNFGTNFSREIDSASAVFRVNLAPVVGFEKYVGSKETFRVMNSNNGVSTNSAVVRSFQLLSTIFIRHTNFVTRRSANLSKAWNKVGEHHPNALDTYMGLRNAHPNTPIYMSHPIFGEFGMIYLHRHLFDPNDNRSVSTGTLAVLLSLMLCDKVTSYEVCSEDSASSEYRYYYTKTRGSYNWMHAKTNEGRLLKMLSISQRPNTSVYEFDMTYDDDSC